ncbi:MAG: SDR family NAD(P)-dependent oxidoreductase [Solirubrobacteraceae bacterium]
MASPPDRIAHVTARDGGWALVTGGSSGIGLEFACALAADGHDLMLAARRGTELERIAADLERRHGIRAVPLAVDLSTPEGPARLITAADRLGPLSVLVNNAGLTLEGRFADHNWAAHEAFLRTMLLAPCELVHRTLPGMLDRRSGMIINVASVSAYWPTTPVYTAYAATKSGLLKFTRALAEEYRGTGVSYSAVCPGITRTAIIAEDTLAGEAARRLPAWLTADPARVARCGLDAARSGTTVVIPAPLDRLVTTLIKHSPERATSRALGKWLTTSYDRWRSTTPRQPDAVCTHSTRAT